MPLTASQQRALNAFNSGENILLLGDPGTGKSTLITAIVKQAKAMGKRVALTASTGIAAQLIGGRTIHSFLKVYPGMSYDGINLEKGIDNLEKTDVLIIDEISMIGHSFINFLYRCLNHTSHHIQLILVGDFYQLPPVKDNYAFTSPCWNLLKLTPCILTEVIRQNDAEFIHNINLLKHGNKSCLHYLLTHSSPIPLDGQISICATKRAAQSINQTKLDELKGWSQTYAAEYNGIIAESDLRVEEYLILKCGMRVMSVVNGSNYSNGSLGTVIGLDSSSVEVLFDNNVRVHFGKERFFVERRDIIGESTELLQIPLLPAYAITIHKSQGQTFKYVNIDGTKCWAPGQLYVAVSRACSIEGIHFLTPIRNENIKTAPAVTAFYDQL